VHGLKLAVDRVDRCHLHHRGGHQHGCAHVDAIELVGTEEQHDGEEIKQDFHEVGRSLRLEV
jgi:hypothetical protein